MAFIEFFVPREYETVWANTETVCTLLLTGRDALGRGPVRQIAEHSSAGFASPSDT